MNRRETAFVLQFQHALWSADGPKSVKGRATCINLRGILNCIALHADFQTGHNSYVSAKTIQQRTGIRDLDTIYRAISVAEEQGWLTRQKGNPFDARGYTYQVHIPENCTGKQYPKISGINNPIQENQGITIPRNSDTTRTYNQNLIEQTKSEGGRSSNSEGKEQTPPPAFEVEEKPSLEEPPPISDVDLGLKAEQPAIEQPGGDNHLLDEFKHLTRRQHQGDEGPKAKRLREIVRELMARRGVKMDFDQIGACIRRGLQNKYGLLDVLDNDAVIDQLMELADSKAGRVNPVDRIKYALQDYGELPAAQHRGTPEAKKPHAPELNGGVSTAAAYLARHGK